MEKGTQRISVTLDDELYPFVKAVSKRHHISLSAATSMLLAEVMEYRNKHGTENDGEDDVPSNESNSAPGGASEAAN